jgi:calcium binding protein
MRDIADIPDIPDRATRLAEITVDCYGREEELSAFDVYLSDALQPLFAASWRDPDEPGHAEAVTILGVADLDERRGILLQVRRRGGKVRRVVAEQIWAAEPASANAIVLEDYRAWVEHGGLDY